MSGLTVKFCFVLLSAHYGFCVLGNNATFETLAPSGNATWTQSEQGTLAILSNLQRINEQSLDPFVNRTRSNNVDVLGDGTRICHIIDLLLYSILTPDGDHMSVQKGFAEAGSSAIALAAEHLNAGNGRVVQELDGLNERCNVRFSTEFFDTAGSPSLTVNQVIDANERQLRRPCAFLGAALSSVSMISSTVSGVLGYPQLSWLSVSSKLSDKEQFPLFARLTMPVEPYASALVGFLYHRIGIRYLNLVHTDSPLILERIKEIQAVAEARYPDMTLRSVPFSGRLTEASIKTVFDGLRQYDLPYTYVSVDYDDYDVFMRKAVEEGLAGTKDRVWIYHEIDFIRLMNRDYEENDPLLLALKGALRLEQRSIIPGVARYDAYESAWREIGSSEDDMEYLRSMLPQHPNSPLYQSFLDSSTFDEVGSYFARAYDATVLLGLAACGASSSNFTGQELFSSMLNVSFTGVTGLVELDPSSRARAMDGGMFRMLNIVGNSLDNGNITLTDVEVGFFNGTNWKYSDSITFSDGTRVVPPDLPHHEEDYNFVDGRLRIIGFSIAGTILLLSISMSLWTILCKSKERVIQAAQPFFLHLICIGVFMMGLSIVPLALTDGSMGDSVANNACLAFPWLLALGWCIAFSALFSKTMRVNILFRNPSFQRVKVTTMDVIRPMVVVSAGKSVLASLRYSSALTEYYSSSEFTFVTLLDSGFPHEV